MKYLILLSLLAISAVSVVHGQCDMTCADVLEDWNVEGTRSCDQATAVEKTSDALQCRIQLGLDLNVGGATQCLDQQAERARAILDAIDNYFNAECTAAPPPTTPPPLDCESDEVLTAANQELIDCKPTDLVGLSLNTILSGNNICLRIQGLMDCVETAAGVCKYRLESIIAQNLVSYQLLSEMFGCDTTVFGRPISRDLQECRFMDLVKCYNPVLAAFGQEEIDDSFDLNKIDDDLVQALLGPLSTGGQVSHCVKVNNFDWASVQSCVDREEVKCPYIGGRNGYSLASVTVDPRAIVTGLRTLYNILSSAGTIQAHCSAECATFANKKALMLGLNCLGQLTSSQLGAVPNCQSVITAVNCAKTHAGSCSLLKEEAALAIGFALNGAAHVTKCTTDSTFYPPASVCVPSAQDQAYAKVQECVFKYPINQFIDGPSVCNKVQAFAWCLQAAAGNCPPVSDYVLKRYGFFFGFINYNFQCTVTLQNNGLSFTATTGTTCDFSTALTCYEPLLTKYGATAVNGKLALAEFLKLLIGHDQGSTPFKTDHCPKLDGLDFATLKTCSGACMFPTFTLPPKDMYTPKTELYTWDIGILFDIDGLQASHGAVCHAGCSSVTSFVSEFQGILACSTVGTDDIATRLPNQIFYNSYLQRCNELQDGCGERKTLEDCLKDKAGTCPYMNSLADRYFLQTTSLAGATGVCATQTGSCIVFPPTAAPTPPTTATARPPVPTSGVAIQPLALMIALAVLIVGVLTK